MEAQRPPVRSAPRAVIGRQMNGIGPGICLIAAIATGCSSNPPVEIPRAAETKVAKQYADRQDQSLVALPAVQTTPAKRTPGQKSEDLTYPAMAQPVSPVQAPRLEYETLSILPVAGSRALRFHLGSQTFDYIEDGEIFMSGPIASGKASSPTPTGKFSVLSKDKDKESTLYDNMVGTPAWMPYSMQFYGNYFIHEGWLPGRPASHGCIRIDHYHAKLLFERMRIGDPVTVSN